MNDKPSRFPILDRFYQDYLNNENSAAFIKSVSQCYTVGTLGRLAAYGECISRRAAVMALGFLADYEANAMLGRAMHDSDRAVRLLAENGIRNLWFRCGTESQRQQLNVISRLLNADQFSEAQQQATQLLKHAPHIAEAWNQRAIAYFNMQAYRESANDCHQALELNPYHFGAAVGMGHCYLELNDAFSALECFRRALMLNPDLEGVRAQVEYLERTLEER